MGDLEGEEKIQEQLLVGDVEAVLDDVVAYWVVLKF